MIAIVVLDLSHGGMFQPKAKQKSWDGLILQSRGITGVRIETGTPEAVADSCTSFYQSDHGGWGGGRGGRGK